MGTEHNQVWGEILAGLVSANFEAIAAGGITVDNGEGAPPDVFEPWMRTETGCWVDTIGDKRIASIRFRAGPEGEPFQETLVTVCEETPSMVVIAQTIPNDEYRFCEVVNMMIHLVIHQRASIKGRPGCCCPDDLEGDEHLHPEFVVPNVLIKEGSNIEVLKPTNIGRGLLEPIQCMPGESNAVSSEAFNDLLLSHYGDKTAKKDNVTPLRVVKKDEPRNA